MTVHIKAKFLSTQTLNEIYLNRMVESSKMLFIEQERNDETWVFLDSPGDAINKGPRTLSRQFNLFYIIHG